MTEPTHDPSSPTRSVAQRLAEELGGYRETPGFPDGYSAVLTPVQQALVSDTFGLLNGVSYGSVTVGQVRIQTNIVRLISELSENSTAEPVKQLITALSSILARAGSAGLTAENQPLTARLTQRNP